MCLSAPVVFEMELEFAKTIVQSPHSPTVMEMKNTIEASALTFLVFHARNAERFAAIVRGIRRGCVLSSDHLGTSKTRVKAIAARNMPK